MNFAVEGRARQGLITDIKPWYPYPWMEDGNAWDTRLASQKPELQYRKRRRSRYVERQQAKAKAHCPSEAVSLGVADTFGCDDPMVIASGIYEGHRDEPSTDDHLVEEDA